MKKKLALVLSVALLALSLAACGQSAAPAAPAAQSVKLTVGGKSAACEIWKAFRLR